MQLPSESASFAVRVRFGLYLARRLKTAGVNSLAADVRAATAAVKQAGRTAEDREDEIQDPLADRDAADDLLDRTAQEARASLAGRGVEAAKQAPYVSIFPEGITVYTAATLETEVARYEELKTRLEVHLPSTDAVRSVAVPAIAQGITQFTAASQAVAGARTALSLAETELDRATDAWERVVEKAYGALIQEVGRSRAESFFQKVRASRAKTKSSGTE